MRLGVPFIAPRQLGVVENKSGRPSLPSVVGRTGQSGARFPSLNSAVDRCRSGSRWRTGHVRCTPDMSGAPFRPLARPRVAHGFRGRPLARLTVGSPDSPVHTGQSGEFWPYAVGEFPRAATSLEAAWRTGHCLVHHRTVRCSRPNSLLAVHSQLFSDSISPVSST
jgi:hypothetical protein